MNLNKLFTILYCLVGGLVIALTTFINFNLNMGELTMANFLLFLPLLIISFVSVGFVVKKVNKVSVSDIIVPTVLHVFIGFVLIFLPVIYRELSESLLYLSNVLLYVFTYVYIVIILISKKVSNQKAVKCMQIIGSVLYLYCVIGSIINCFVKVIEYTA